MKSIEKELLAIAVRKIEDNFQESKVEKNEM